MHDFRSNFNQREERAVCTGSKNKKTLEEYEEEQQNKKKSGFYDCRTGCGRDSDWFIGGDCRRRIQQGGKRRQDSKKHSLNKHALDSEVALRIRSQNHLGDDYDV